MKLALTCLLILLAMLTLAAMVLDKPHIDKTSCVGCQDCLGVCPVGAIRIVDEKAEIDSEKCINCMFCVWACTYKAVKNPK